MTEPANISRFVFVITRNLHSSNCIHVRVIFDQLLLCCRCSMTRTVTIVSQKRYVDLELRRIARRHHTFRRAELASSQSMSQKHHLVLFCVCNCNKWIFMKFLEYLQNLYSLSLSVKLVTLDILRNLALSADSGDFQSA